MILAEELSKKFDDFLAVDHVSFQVRSGEILALLGPNGAGKTTTVRMLTSILRPTSGHASILGYDVVKDADKVRSLVGVLTEQHGLYVRMTAEDYLDFFGQLYGLDRNLRQKQAKELLDEFGLSATGKKRLGEFSKGMRQKLALVRALMHNPPVLLLDEPTSAMDPESARIVRESIFKMRSAERAIIFCTHNLAEAESLADKIAIIQQGRIILNGSLEALKHELLGQVEFEIRLASPFIPEDLMLPEGIDLTTCGPDWLRFHTDTPVKSNPALLKNLIDNDFPVISLQEVPRSLEQVYIQAISSEVTDGRKNANVSE